MKPISSGSTLRWLGGNNSITGTPSSAGIWLGTGAYPLIDSGYNYIDMTSDYISGIVPSSIRRELPARLNCWRDAQESKYTLDSGSTVIYSPAYDCNSMPSTNGTELNSIGFGLYDTVYTNSGDNPIADQLYIQAYIAENENDYSTAITKYKDLVSDYRKSSFASISLSKIFNCIEKSNSN